MAKAVHGFTVMARDPDASAENKSKINNFIHYLAGHLIVLTDPEEPLTDSRLDAIVSLVEFLNRRLAEDIRADLTR